MYELKDKIILITGGAAGIGAGVVEALLEEDAKHVAILDLDSLQGKTLEEKLVSKHGENKAKFYKCDVTTKDLENAFEDVINQFGYVDVVINNAGIMNDSPDVYEKEIAVNMTALITSSLKAYDLMRKDRGGKGGTIINISSIVGLYQSRVLPIYCATKSAVLQFSNTLGMEPHYSRSGVRIVTLCFGCTKTSLFSEQKMAAIDQETHQLILPSLKTCPWQEVASAVNGFIHAFKNGASASTWLITSGRPAEDITANVTKAYKIMSQGIFDK